MSNQFAVNTQSKVTLKNGDWVKLGIVPVLVIGYQRRAGQTRTSGYE